MKTLKSNLFDSYKLKDKTLLQNIFGGATPTCYGQSCDYATMGKDGQGTCPGLVQDGGDWVLSSCNPATGYDSGIVSGGSPSPIGSGR